MIPVPDLNFGYNDAQTYRGREYKELFNKFFIRTKDLDKLCENNTYFLIGEKGTGKTAYAVYISNTEYKEKIGIHKHVRETDYLKFIKLKLGRHLQLSDYTDIWSVIIYLLLSQQILEREKNITSISKYWKFRAIQKAIDEFYYGAFSPEIIHAMRFVDDLKLSVQLLTKYFNSEGKTGAGISREITTDNSRFQMNLYYIQKQFEEALSSISLSKSYILFIDGIDVRPSGVPFDEYLECVKGLANAAWAINNDIFSSIKDSKGRLRVVLLLRPDIFESLGLQNQNNKLRDNSILLDWRTKYPIYRKSPIFEVADNILKVQQTREEITNLNKGDAWDYYFPYDVEDEEQNSEEHSAFKDFLKYSLSRPRDIVTMLNILKITFENKGKNPNEVFSREDFQDPDFRDQLATYFLGEIRDELLFYYSEDEYRTFITFFPYLKGASRFSYQLYKSAFDLYHDFITRNNYAIPAFCDNEDNFLQFLYNHNIICYIDDTTKGGFIRWCYREREYGNISPKVRTHTVYLIHYGMLKAFNTGKIVL